MKILILTASQPLKIAGIVAYDLYIGLKRSGSEVKILTKAWDKYLDKNIVPIDSTLTEYKHRFWNLLRRIIIKLLKVFLGFKVKEEPKVKTDPNFAVQGEDQTVTIYKTKKILRRAGFVPDAIIVLFMPHFLSFRNLHELNQVTKAPIYLYLMDMASMTGGCHYAWDCKGYEKKCGNCPAFYSINEQDSSRTNWEFKKKYIDKTEITAIAGTEWQYQQLKKSSLFSERPMRKILLSIDNEVFKPGDKNQARAYFKLPVDKKIIFFGAVYFDRNRNKGFRELIIALNYLKNTLFDASTVHIAIAGHASKSLEESLSFDYTYLGYLNIEKLALAFQAADVFVSPSIEDSGPMMINQSIMSGTPVVSFEMGAALDLVINGQTGYRVRLLDSEALANGIRTILELDEASTIRISNNCRELGLQLCHSRKQIEKMLEIINPDLTINI